MNTCACKLSTAFNNLLFGTLLKWYYAVLALLHVNIVIAAQRQAQPLALPVHRLFFNTLHFSDPCAPPLS